MAWTLLLLGAASLVQAAPVERAAAGGAAAVFRVDSALAGGAGDRIFATVEAALEAATELKRRQSSAAVRIEIADGDYYLAAPLMIGPELSGTRRVPTVIAAAPAAAPRLLAGRKLTLQWRP